MHGFRRLLAMNWLALLALVLSACSGPAERIWLNAPGWYRAGLVGETQVVDPVSMALDDAGYIYFFLTGGDRADAYPRIVALSRQAEVAWDRTYDLAMKWADQTQILWDGQALNLLWLSNRGLYRAQLEATSGDILGFPTLLSGGVRVGSYDTAQDSHGLITIWYAGVEDSPGIYALPPGHLTGEAIPVDPLGIRPDIEYDPSGRLHAIWARYPTGDIPQFLYAAYPGGTYMPDQETPVFEPRVGTSNVFGPWLGLDSQHVYVLWTVVPRIGQAAGAATTNYIHFPYAQPDRTSPVNRLYIPYTYRLVYEMPATGSLRAGPRVPLPNSQSDYITHVAVNPAPAPELVIAFHTRVEYLRRQEQGQVGAVFFRDGSAAGYQLLSFTPGSSDYPYISADKAGDLYVTWLESGTTSGYLVYFASTTPDIRNALSKLTPDDIGRLASETVFGLLSGVVLFPWVLAWLMVPLVLLILTSPLRREEAGLGNPGVVISLVLILVTYWIGKLAFMPGLADYVPFSAWLPIIPKTLNTPLRLLVPVLITGAALAIAWRYTYRSHRASMLFFLLIYAAVDGALTMAVYGTVFYGAF